jgi:adenylate cyclase
MGLSALSLEAVSDEDLEIMRYAAAMLDAGFPVGAYLQILRVYGQAIAQIADAEVRLFHLYVHEPLMREGVPGVEIAEEMEGLTREVLPFAAPLMTYLHGRCWRTSSSRTWSATWRPTQGRGGSATEAGRLRVAIAFADLAGYTRLTSSAATRRRWARSSGSWRRSSRRLPLDARVIKTLGDEVMVVGADPAALTGWAVELAGAAVDGEPAPRIGIHYGQALYRDGDYYGRDVNQAARVVARAAGGEVLVTRPVVDVAGGRGRPRVRPHRRGRLKGFSEPTELFIASARKR